jgi:hypothetical protein
VSLVDAGIFLIGRYQLRGRRLAVSIVTVEELLEGAESINADVVGADRAAFERLGARYLRF